MSILIDYTDENSVFAICLIPEEEGINMLRVKEE